MLCQEYSDQDLDDVVQFISSACIDAPGMFMFVRDIYRSFIANQGNVLITYKAFLGHIAKVDPKLVFRNSEGEKLVAGKTFRS